LHTLFSELQYPAENDGKSHVGIVADPLLQLKPGTEEIHVEMHSGIAMYFSKSSRSIRRVMPASPAKILSPHGSPILSVSLVQEMKLF
jgi:hypothetical protein